MVEQSEICDSAYFYYLYPNECIKNFITFHLQLNERDVLKLVILLTTCLIKYASKLKKDLNLRVFNMITGIHEWKTLTKPTSCESKYRFDARKCNSDQRWNNDKCRYKCEEPHVCEKGYVWNPATCNCKNEKYLARVMDD